MKQQELNRNYIKPNQTIIYYRGSGRQHLTIIDIYDSDNNLHQFRVWGKITEDKK